MDEEHRRLQILKQTLHAVNKKVPENADVLFHLGLLYLRCKQPKKAEECFTQYKSMTESTGINPQHHAQLLQHLALCKSLEERANYETSNDGAFQTAHGLLVEATKLDNRQGSIWNDMGLLFLCSELPGNFEGARIIFEPVLQSFPYYLDAMNNLALAYRGLGKVDEAAELLQKVILTDPCHTEALINCAMVFLQSERVEAAQQLLERALTLNGRLAAAWNNLGCVYNRLGRRADAERAFATARQYAGTAEGSAETVGDGDAVGGGADEAAGFNQGRHHRSSQPERAAAQLEGLVLQRPSPQAWAALAAAYAALHDQGDDPLLAAKAEKALQAAQAAAQPANGVVWGQLGLLYLQLANYPLAEQCFREAAAADRLGPAACCNLAVCLQLEGKQSAIVGEEELSVEELYRRALAGLEGVDSGDTAMLRVSVLHNLGNYYRQAGQYEQALEALRSCMRARSDNPQVYNSLGLLYVATRQWDAADQMFGLALRLDPAMDSARANRAKLRYWRAVHDELPPVDPASLADQPM